MKLHGGEISVESQLGTGSTFRVRVPLGFAHLDAARIASPRALEPGSLGATPFLEEALGWLTPGDAPRDPWVAEPRLDARYVDRRRSRKPASTHTSSNRSSSRPWTACSRASPS